MYRKGALHKVETTCIITIWTVLRLNNYLYENTNLTCDYKNIMWFDLVHEQGKPYSGGL